MWDLQEYVAHLWAAVRRAWRGSQVVVGATLLLILVVSWWVGSALLHVSQMTFYVGMGGVIALNFLLIAPYRLYQSNKKTINELREELTPKLKCTLDENDAGCKRINTSLNGTSMKCNWYRLKVETAAQVSVTGCKGVLTEIRRGDNIVMTGEKLIFPFAHSQQEDSTNKTVYPGVPEYMDFMLIAYDNAVALTPFGFVSSSVNWAEIFSLPGEYKLRITITSSNAPSVPLDIDFHWTLNWQTSRLSLGTPISSR